MTFDVLAHPIIFSDPDRLVEESAWAGHIPFAYLLVDLLRPRRFVELGTHYGVSYGAFCKAVKLLGSNTQCVAVDTWEGDAHSGLYGPKVLADLKKHHDPRYSSFSRLFQTDFASAASTFADGSIDLLHIDGLHTYEAVKRDFSTYYPKLSDRGVVIFHDSDVRKGDFGVYRLMEELAPRYPHFEFPHSWGLAAFLIGAAVPRPMVEFVNAANAAPDAYRGLFGRLGELWETKKVTNLLTYVQFQQMQALNAVKARLGSAVDPNTQSPDVALSQPLAFAGQTLREMTAMLNKIPAPAAANPAPAKQIIPPPTSGPRGGRR